MKMDHIPVPRKDSRRLIIWDLRLLAKLIGPGLGPPTFQSRINTMTPKSRSTGVPPPMIQRQLTTPSRAPAISGPAKSPTFPIDL